MKIVKKLNILVCVLLCLLLAACGKSKTVVIGNVNLPTYMSQLTGVWDNNDSDNKAYTQIEFTSNDKNEYLINLTDSYNVTKSEKIDDLIANDDYMKTYSVVIKGKNKYSFYMTDSNNIVFENAKFQKQDEYFDSSFASIEGSWTNEEGVKVTFFVNNGNRYVNFTDGMGTFNKRIFDIDAAYDKESGNYIMTKEGANFINFYYDLQSDASLSFYDYTLYRNEDTSDYEALKAEEIKEEASDDETSSGYDLTTHGNKTGYEVADYSGDIPTDVAYIFVGDSRFVGMDQACGISKKSNQFVVAKVGMGYSWLNNEAIKEVDQIISSHSASGWVVIYCLGVNDLGNLSRYKSFYKNLAGKPYKTVLVSVNPVGNYPKISNETIENFNNSIKGLGYTYIDTYSYLMNERGYISPDGLHYNNTTYKDIYRYIIYSVKGIQLSEADRQALDNQYHGNAISNNAASENSVSTNEASNSGKTYNSLEEYYYDENNSVEFSNRIQEIKAASSSTFSNVTVTVKGNTIIYNYSYANEVPDVDWESTDKQLESNAVVELTTLHEKSKITTGIKIGYIYYDNQGNEIHSYYAEG